LFPLLEKILDWDATATSYTNTQYLLGSSMGEGIEPEEICTRGSTWDDQNKAKKYHF